MKLHKVIERLVLACLHLHLLGSRNFGQFQSTYRKQHSTETALSEVVDTVRTRQLRTSKSPFSSASTYLQPSIYTLLQRLQTEFGVTGTVLSWLQSYLSCQSQSVKLGNHAPVTSSQPQRRRPSRIRTGTHPVCCLLQSSG